MKSCSSITAVHQQSLSPWGHNSWLNFTYRHHAVIEWCPFSAEMTVAQFNTRSAATYTKLIYILQWWILQKKKLYALYFSTNIIRVIKSRRLGWTGHVACMEESGGAYRFLVWKPERRRPLGRQRSRWEDNTKMDFREVGWGMEWIDLAQDRNRWPDFVNAVMNLLFP